jgi:Flp pilus assembly protein TadD
MGYPNTYSDSDRRSADELAHAGSILLNNGRFKEALALFEVAIRRNPENVRAQFGAGCALVRIGDLEQALARVEAVLRIAPDEIRALALSGHCLQRLGRPEEARKAFEHALTLDPQDNVVLYNFACFWAIAGDEDRCREYLTKAAAVVEPHTLEHMHRDPDLGIFAGRAWFKDLQNNTPRPPA